MREVKNGNRPIVAISIVFPHTNADLTRFYMYRNCYIDYIIICCYLILKEGLKISNNIEPHNKKGIDA